MTKEKPKTSISTTDLNRLKYPQRKKSAGIKTSDPEFREEIHRRDKLREQANAPDQEGE